MRSLYVLYEARQARLVSHLGRREGCGLCHKRVCTRVKDGGLCANGCGARQMYVEYVIDFELEAAREEG